MNLMPLDFIYDFVKLGTWKYENLEDFALV